MTGESSTKPLRLFIAIPMPEAVRNEIAGVQRELQRLVPPNAVRWTKPDQFHLTLKFLGDVAVEQVAGLQEAIKVVCASGLPLVLRAQGVGFFPNARSPRVIWAGVDDGAGRLAGVQKGIEDAVRLFASGQGTEAFAGHVTLGRVKFLKRPEIEKLAAQAQDLRDRRFGEWTAAEIELVQSELLPAGARHSALAVFPLAAVKP